MRQYPAICSLFISFLAAGLAAASEPSPVISPTDHVIRLLNGKDLAGWYSWLKATGREDPNTVFSREGWRDPRLGRGVGLSGHGEHLRGLSLGRRVQVGPRDTAAPASSAMPEFSCTPSDPTAAPAACG